MKSVTNRNTLSSLAKFFFVGLAFFLTTSLIPAGETDGLLARIGSQAFHHGDRIQALAYQPKGKLLATAGGNDVTRLWHRDSGQLVGTIPVRWVETLCFSPDGKSIVLGDAFGKITIWNTKSLELQQKLVDQKNAITHMLRYGDILISADLDGNVILFDLARNDQKVLMQQSDGIREIAVMPQQNEICLVTGNHAVFRYDVKLGLKKNVPTAGLWINSVSYSTDGNRILIATENQTKEWQRADDDLKDMVGQNPNCQIVRAVPNSSRVLLVDSNGKLTLSDDKGKSVKLSLPESCKVIGAMDVSPEGDRVVFVGADGLLHQCDLNSGKEISFNDTLLPPLAEIFVVTGDRMFLARDSNGGIWRIDWNSKSSPKQLLAPNFESPVFLTLVGSHAYVCSGQKLLKLSNIASPNPTVKELATLKEQSFATALAFNNATQQFAIGYEAGGVRIVAENGMITKTIPYAKRVSSLAFSPDGKSLAISGYQGATVWNVSNWTALMSVSPEKPVSHVCVSPNRQMIATAHYDGTIALWNMEDGEKIRELEGHTGTVNHISFDRSCVNILSCSTDRTVRSWEICTGKQNRIWQGHNGDVESLAIHANGRCVSSVGKDGTIVIWDVTGLQDENLAIKKQQLANQQLDQTWNLLASAKADEGQRAMWLLLSDPETSVDFLHKRVFLVDRNKVNKLIKDLNANRFAVRERATKALAGYGQWIKARLVEASKNPESLEVRLRLQALIDKLNNAQTLSLEQERFRMIRTIFALEQINSPRARELLTNLVTGAVESAIADRAKETLARLQ